MAIVQNKDQAKDGDVWFDENNQLRGKGIVRTDETCSHHNCRKTFVMTVNFEVNGNYVVVCPHCGHQHCRVIENGVVTKDRWDSRYEHVEIPENSVWGASNFEAETKAPWQHIRQKWFG